MNYQLNFYGNREGEKETFAVTVPGDIQKDYAEFKNFGDHHYGLNATKFDAIEDSTWYYFAEFDYVDGNKYKFCLYSNDAPYAGIIRFDINVNYCIEKEITFLMELLDYIDNDSKR